MSKKVIIGLSGGVDSSVAAWALKEQGYEVAGLFMRNWRDTTGLLQSDCHWEDDLMFAEMVAAKLGISFQMVDLSEQYRLRVVDYMFDEYAKGRTPNPDVLCNREIKFDSFAEEARKLGGDFVATGHYCRKEEIKTGNTIIYRLLSGVDENKDQSYFLCQLRQEQLAYSLFPIGGLTKPEVRKIADDIGLATARRKDSQGICFVGKVHLPVFLQQKLEAKRGNIIEIPRTELAGLSDAEFTINDVSEEDLETAVATHDLNPDMGKVIGTHNGAHFFTIGQRKGINVGGYKDPLFVVATDVKNNIIYTGEGQSHPLLYRRGLFIRCGEIHWIRRDLSMNEGESRDYMVRIRYRQALQKARIFLMKKGMYIIFNKLQRGIAPGQFAAWYDGEELIGSGVIDR